MKREIEICERMVREYRKAATKLVDDSADGLRIKADALDTLISRVEQLEKENVELRNGETKKWEIFTGHLTGKEQK